MWQASKTHCRAKFASNNAQFVPKTTRQASQNATLVRFFVVFTQNERLDA